MRLSDALPPYDEALLQDAFQRRGLSFYALGRMAKVNDKTARAVVMTGRAHPRSIYRVAKALGFRVKPDNLSAIMRRVA
jgi:hypothetical protein